MSVKFVKYGIPYFKQIYWTPQMDGPRESDNPADNLGGLGDMGFGGGGGGMGGGSGTGGGGGFGGAVKGLDIPSLGAPDRAPTQDAPTAPSLPPTSPF